MVLNMSTNYNINLTESALQKIYSIVEKEKDRNSVLRIAVSGGGCSSFKYNFLVDQVLSNDEDDDEDESDYEHDDDDDNDEDNDDEDNDYQSHFSFGKKGKDVIISDSNGNPVLMVDNCSAKFLQGSIIDYTEDLSGSGFQIKNKLAKSQCGCGNSFSI